MQPSSGQEEAYQNPPQGKYVRQIRDPAFGIDPEFPIAILSSLHTSIQYEPACLLAPAHASLYAVAALLMR